jgi:hypothetical protein
MLLTIHLAFSKITCQLDSLEVSQSSKINILNQFYLVETIKVPAMGDSITEGTIEEFVKRKYKHTHRLLDSLVTLHQQLNYNFCFTLFRTG